MVVSYGYPDMKELVTSKWDDGGATYIPYVIGFLLKTDQILDVYDGHFGNRLVLVTNLNPKNQIKGLQVVRIRLSWCPAYCGRIEFYDKKGKKNIGGKAKAFQQPENYRKILRLWLL